MKREAKGITLIALVVTIIVVLILASITIGTLVGENGSIGNSKRAREQTEIENEKEILGVAIVSAMKKNKYGDIIKDNLDSELDKNVGNGKYGTKEVDEGIAVTFTDSKRSYLVDGDGNIEEYIIREPEPTPEDSKITTLSQMKYGVIEVEFLSGTGYTITAIPNPPILKDGMTAVYWDGTEEINDENTSNWYEYIAQTSTTESGGTSRWANAKTSDGSYYVWIPRYSYRIVYFDTEEHENAYRAGTLTEEEALENNYIVGYSDARGIVDKEGKKPKEVSSQTGIAVNNKYFRTHPVFDGNVDEGGWSSKLTGIWVMKYEASKNDASSSTQVNGTTPKSLPGVQSWTYTDVGKMYTYAKETYNKGGELNTILNSHLMKNSEWGAVAYLTDSKYGRNGTEMVINNSASCITGSSGGSVDASGDDEFYAYNTDKGYLASSTGNIYGIYDLSGGAEEYVAICYRDATANLSYSSTFFSKISNSYMTAYGGNIKNDYIIGDATYETNGWNEDRGCWFLGTHPCLGRGAAYWDKKNAGIFGFWISAGFSGSILGFRVCLAIK